MEFKDRVLKTYHKNNKNWIIALSADRKKLDESYTPLCPIEKINITFIVLKNDYYIEWIPNYGPITVIEKCEKDFFESETIKAKKDYIFDYSKGRRNWAQLACERLGLNDLLLESKYDRIFELLEENF